MRLKVLGYGGDRGCGQRLRTSRARSTASTPPRPRTASTVVYVVRTLIASTTERSKYSLNSQNPGSLTWEKAIEPQQTASTIISGCTPPPARSGSTTPEAVTTATV